jgi:hypothetical protein
MIERALKETLLQCIDYQKAIILFGARQVGKTTLVRDLAQATGIEYEYYNGDSLQTRNLWTEANVELLKRGFGNKKLIIVDEAQMIPNIGLICKQLIDARLGIQFVITGSSALDIAYQTQEPLTGRKWEYMLYPLSVGEWKRHFGLPQTLDSLSQHLVFGMYPEVATGMTNPRELLDNIASSYLYKDILALTGIKKPLLLEKILRALAWQVGSEVSLHEVANLVAADVKTVDTYIHLLEQTFVVYRLGALSRNERNEISTKKKIYFYDNGIRNALIGNFSPLDLRNDVGQLWENFALTERKKQLSYERVHGFGYFWRNKNKAEIDYIEEIDGQLHAFEFKWNPKTKAKFPEMFLSGYQPITTQIIHPQNYWDWLTSHPYTKP